MKTITLPLADVAALVRLAWELTRHLEETDRSATGSIYGIEYADRTIAKVAAMLPDRTPFAEVDRSAFSAFSAIEKPAVSPTQDR